MAVITTDPGQEAGKLRVYDFAEGYGSIYGRYVRKRLCQRLIAQHSIRTVLEAPCNSESYFTSPGSQSVVFAEQGCAVTLLHPEEEVVRKTRGYWAALGLPHKEVIHHTDLYHLPFKDDKFDLVWNFDHVALCDDPPRFIGEMARVSGNLVMILAINHWNIGYPIHVLLNLLGHRQSIWGAREWMAIGPVERALRSFGFTTVERGLVDVPPWPGYDAMNAIGRFMRRRTPTSGRPQRTDAETEQMLSKLTFIEYAPLPNTLKMPFAHQLYILARK